MSKGLEEIKNPIGCEFNVTGKKYVYREDQVDIIEKELKDYQEIKTYMQQYEISEIEELRRILHNDWVIRQKFKTDTANVAKAFEIIKEKGIDIIELKRHKKAKAYNEATKRTYCEEYTEEEYDLLRELLL